SLTELLKEHDIKLSTAKANTKLIELGLLEIKERPSGKGGVKEFKSLTDKGLEYGKNLISPNNSKETQPHYYPSKFMELSKELGITKEQLVKQVTQ
ncbi:KilA-N domain-containing protein, partial [Escherichia coli]|nr:KilA-N domain-containing protein [Escherichia coli]